MGGDAPEAPGAWEPSASADPPAALLRRAISHVESLLQRLEPLAPGRERPAPTVVPLESIAELAWAATPPVRPAPVLETSPAGGGLSPEQVDEPPAAPAADGDRVSFGGGVAYRIDAATAGRAAGGSSGSTRPAPNLASEGSDLSPLAATAEALRTVLRAEQDAGRIRAGAAAEGERLLREAQALADRVVAEARQRAEEMLAEARDEVAGLVAAAQRDADTVERALDDAACRARAALADYREARTGLRKPEARRAAHRFGGAGSSADR